MGILQGTIKGTHVSVFFLLALSTAMTMTIFTPRVATAKDSLVGTVDCLVRNVSSGHCKPEETSTPKTSNSGSSNNSSQQSAPPQPSSTNTTSNSDKKPSQTIAIEPVPLPENIEKLPAQVQPVSATISTNGDVSGAEYLAYFNKYSKYAIAGSQQAATAIAPIERTGEGWKIFGVAWYWWGIGALALGVIITSVNRKIPSKI